MVNPDSDLFARIPDYAVITPNRTRYWEKSARARSLQFDVRDYIVENVFRILDDANIDYVKWDMNRHISDAYSPALANQGEFYHRYILGLYDILARIFVRVRRYCSSPVPAEGKRFDIGNALFLAAGLVE
jgi:alpha-galactosidase